MAAFVLGAILGTAIGVIMIAPSATLGCLIFGVWVTGVCLNSGPLALFALSFPRRGRLDAALVRVDVRRELRHYTRRSSGIAVPLLFVILAARRAAARGGLRRI